MPPHKYIILLRLRAARRLISEAELSITEAAHECGFYDASHLKKYLDKENAKFQKIKQKMIENQSKDLLEVEKILEYNRVGRESYD